MEEAIRDFPEQFKWQAEIVNAEKLALGHQVSKWIICGMGGSALAAGLLKVAEPKLDLLIHRDYGLPRVPDYFLQESLIILSSYSGNTEEVLDMARLGLEQKLNLAVITTGGALLEFAQTNNLPYVQLPDTHIQPRSALGYGLRALAKLTGQAMPDQLELVDQEINGKNLAEKIRGKIPLIYSSTINLPLAYNWKIKFNETGKIPAFYNVLPELNHNEMTGFDGSLARAELNKQFYALFLTDKDDDPRISQRFQILETMYRDRGLITETLPLGGPTIWQKIFNSLLLADWAAYYTARLNNDEPERVDMVEEFKKLL